MKVSSKFFIITVILVSFFIWFSQAAFVYLVDPLQIYRKHFLVEQQFFRNARYQDAGLINSYLNSEDGYDSIIIGTSLSQNFTPSYVQEEFGWGKVLNLSLSGGFALEKRIVIESALETGKVKNVIWEIYRYEGNNVNDIRFDTFPDYLYHRGLDDYKYLLNRDVFADAIGMMDYKEMNRLLWEVDLDNYNKWWSERRVEEAIEFNFPDNLSRMRDILDTVREAQDWENYSYQYEDDFPNIDMNILPLVDEYPDVQFYFFFPPSSTYKYAVTTRLTNLNRLVAMRQYMVEKFQGYDNVHIYGFDNIEWLVDDLANYKDEDHYDVDISNFIIAAMSENQYLLTADNLEQYKMDFIRRVKDYQVYSSLD